MGQIVNLPVPTFWESRLPTDELIKAASGDPSLWQTQAGRIAKMDVNLLNGSLQWQESAQVALGRIANASGVPSGLAGTMGNLVLDMATGTPVDRVDLAFQLADHGIGMAVNLMGAIPIVGAIAGAINGMARFLVALSKDYPPEIVEVLPPLVDYSEEVDQYVVNSNVLPALGGLDWTDLCTPRHTGDWRVYERENGWAMRPEFAGSGAGFMPGTQRMSSTIQTYLWSKSVRTRRDVWIAQGRDMGIFYPGATQMLTAMLEQVGKPQTQLYNVYTDDIKRQWRDHYEGGFALATAIYERRPSVMNDTGLSKIQDSQIEWVVGALTSNFQVGVGDRVQGAGTWGWKPGRPKRTIEDVFIRPWCDRIKQRQKHFLGTIIGTAYTSEDQPAFKDPEMLAQLRTNRSLLLKHPARFKVNVLDMVDEEYRDAIWQSTVGSTIAVSPSAIESAVPFQPTVPDTAPLPPGGGAPFEEPTKKRSPLVGVAMIGAGLYVARKKGWI